MAPEIGDPLDVTGLVIILRELSLEKKTAFLIFIKVFYSAVGGFGIWAGWKNRHKGKGNNGYIVGDRSVLNPGHDLFISFKGHLDYSWDFHNDCNLRLRRIHKRICRDCFSKRTGLVSSVSRIITGNINVINSYSAVGYSLSLAVGGIFFARQMRATGATTMIDPLKEKVRILIFLKN